MTFADFLSKLSGKGEIDSINLNLIEKAFNFSQKAHIDQKRLSGEPYFEHCARTALNLSELKLDPETISAGLLHDTLEDTETTEKDLIREFGEEICFLVQAVSKIGNIKYKEKNLKEAEILRKLILVFAEDIRVALIKLADRLDNMRTLKYLPEEKVERIALETLDVYAPLAVRLGISNLAYEFEDLAFQYLYPKEYKWLLTNLKNRYGEREKYLDRVKSVLEALFVKNNIKIVNLEYRAKRYYSIYKKLSKYNFDLNQIYDLLAFRIIVEEIEDCYAALGIIHSTWMPVAEKFKDYIALPKPNGYQSIHTTVVCLGGKFVEFQIRTSKMHEHSEFGIAAHLVYSEKKETKDYSKGRTVFADKKELQWIKQLTEWQKEFTDSNEYLSALKIEFFEERIFVITPKGKIIELPQGSTPVDFAYKIHTDIGNHCMAAKINGKIAPLSHELNSGDVVEIIVNKNKKPSADWLDFIKTANAKKRIKMFFAENNYGLLPSCLTFNIAAKDKIGLLNEITKIISSMGINIESSSSKNQGGIAYLKFKLEVGTKEELRKLKNKLGENIKGVKYIHY